MGFLIAFVIGAVAGAFSLHLFILGREEKLFTRSKELAEDKAKLEKLREDLANRDRACEGKESALVERLNKFNQNVISYEELKKENTILKRDLQNIDVSLEKRNLDFELQAQRQAAIESKSNELAEEYLADTQKQISRALRMDNYVGCKDKLLKAVNWCREIGYAIPQQREDALVAQLRSDYEMVVRVAVEREEQARIKAQMREEERVRRELEREREQAEREKAAVAQALAKAMSEAKDQHGAEIAALQSKLAEAEARSQRALSMAQQTRAGNVYVISNIGSFGENVFKIGMTRRLDPLERVAELGDASVPFPFDVHMMITCSDAPSLENALHQAFHKARLNKINPRKEYFNVSLAEIVEVVKTHHGEVEYTADAEALQYRQSLQISDEDAEFIEEAFEKAEGSEQTAARGED